MDFFRYLLATIGCLESFMRLIETIFSFNKTGVNSNNQTGSVASWAAFGAIDGSFVQAGFRRLDDKK